MNWDEYWLNMANVVATKSKDRSTKAGCVIVTTENEILSIGFNGMCRNSSFDDDDWANERPEKYFHYEHAERNAIYNAARNGIALLGSVLYVTGPPCVDCGRAIVQAGVQEVIWDSNNPFETKPEVWERWKKSCSKSEEIMRDCGVEIVRIKKG